MRSVGSMGPRVVRGAVRCLRRYCFVPPHSIALKQEVECANNVVAMAGFHVCDGCLEGSGGHHAQGGGCQDMPLSVNGDDWFKPRQYRTLEASDHDQRNNDPAWQVVEHVCLDIDNQ